MIKSQVISHQYIFWSIFILVWHEIYGMSGTSAFMNGGFRLVVVFFFEEGNVHANTLTVKSESVVG